jgi:hypothetical protein
VHGHDGLARVEEVQQQPKEAYVNVGEVNCGESIAEVARSVLQYGSVERSRSVIKANRPTSSGNYCPSWKLPLIENLTL